MRILGLVLFLLCISVANASFGVMYYTNDSRVFTYDGENHTQVIDLSSNFTLVSVFDVYEDRLIMSGRASGGFNTDYRMMSYNLTSQSMMWSVAPLSVFNSPLSGVYLPDINEVAFSVQISQGARHAMINADTGAYVRVIAKDNAVNPMVRHEDGYLFKSSGASFTFLPKPTSASSTDAWSFGIGHNSGTFAISGYDDNAMFAGGTIQTRSTDNGSLVYQYDTATFGRGITDNQTHIFATLFDPFRVDVYEKGSDIVTDTRTLSSGTQSTSRSIFYHPNLDRLIVYNPVTGNTVTLNTDLTDDEVLIENAHMLDGIFVSPVMSVGNITSSGDSVVSVSFDYERGLLTSCMISYDNSSYVEPSLVTDSFMSDTFECNTEESYTVVVSVSCFDGWNDDEINVSSTFECEQAPQESTPVVVEVNFIDPALLVFVLVAGLMVFLAIKVHPLFYAVAGMLLVISGLIVVIDPVLMALLMIIGSLLILVSVFISLTG